MNYGISILRIESGLDYTELLNDELSEYFLSNENNESSSSSSDDEEIKIKESFIDLNSAKTLIYAAVGVAVAILAKGAPFLIASFLNSPTSNVDISTVCGS